MMIIKTKILVIRFIRKKNKQVLTYFWKVAYTRISIWKKR